VRFNELYFSLALLAFTSLDLATWFYLRRSFLPLIIEASRKKYKSQGDCYGQIKLEIVVFQIVGNWKLWRHGSLFAIVIVMVLIALSPRLKSFLSSEAHSIFSAITPDTTRRLLQDFLLLLFLIVSEISYLAVRMRTLLAIRLLNEMESRFTVSPRLNP
jgi:hypothetical protein